MALTRDEVATFAKQFIVDESGGDPNTIKETDDLRTDLLFDDDSLVALGKDLNDKNWHNVRVTPVEMVNCIKVKDFIDLLFSKHP